MSDDHAFHLTPLDVRSQEFARAMRGYDRAQVDEFKLAISEELERLLRDRAQQEERLRGTQEQLRAFRDREHAWLWVSRSDRAQVDEFKLAISEELERLLRDRAQHEERLRGVQEQLRAFRDRERAMNEALVAAQ